MENVVNQYLAALVAHDPKRLPLSKDVMYTENAQRVEPGDGFWKTVEGRGDYTQIFADPEFGQAAFMGTMREAGALLLMSLRLRIELGRITEIESVYFRPGGGGPNNIADMDKFKPENIWFKSIPPAQQMSRQELIAVADGYFTGLQKNDGKGINGTGTYPFTNDCHRIENGAPTTNVPKPGKARGQFEVGMLHGLQPLSGLVEPLDGGNGSTDCIWLQLGPSDPRTNHRIVFESTNRASRVPCRRSSISSVVRNQDPCKTYAAAPAWHCDGLQGKATSKDSRRPAGYEGRPPIPELEEGTLSATPQAGL